MLNIRRSISLYSAPTSIKSHNMLINVIPQGCFTLLGGHNTFTGNPKGQRDQYTQLLAVLNIP